MIRFKLTLNNIFREIGNHRIIFFALLLQSIIGFVLVLILLSSCINTNSALNSYNKVYGNKHFYSVNMGLDEQDALMANKNEYDRVVRFLDLVNKSNDYKYIPDISCNMDIYGKTFPLKFNFQYELGNLETDCKDGNGNSYQSLKCLSMSKEGFNQYGIKTESGTAFYEDDFVYSKNKTIPVLLGCEYKGILNIGDKLNGAYFENCQLKVVGFLKENSSYVNDGKVTYLDRYMVVPAFIPAIKNPSKEQVWMLCSQFQGSLITSKDIYESDKFITDCSIKSTVSDLFVIQDHNSNSIISVLNSSKELFYLLLILTISLIVFTIISLSFTLLGLIRENYYEYGIHLMCGASLKSIFYNISGYSAFLLIISFIISIILTQTDSIQSETFYLAFGIAILIFIISVIPSFFAVRKLDVSSLIRGKE